MANENNYDVYKPEWIPEGAKDEQYPGFVMTGVNVQDAKPKAPIHKPKNYTAEELIDGIINKTVCFFLRLLRLLKVMRLKHF